MIDWTVNFNEQYLLPKVALYSPTTDTQTIGLAPAVTSLLVTSDGGKMMAGYGKFDGFTTFGWILKLFGTDGTVTGCGVGAKPSGY
jgi:ethanolamine utilization protein EutQ (cupin superfamily)